MATDDIKTFLAGTVALHPQYGFYEPTRKFYCMLCRVPLDLPPWHPWHARCPECCAIHGHSFNGEYPSMNATSPDQCAWCGAKKP